MRRFAALLFCFGVLLYEFPTSAEKGGRHPAFYVFGDSLVDNGNDLIATGDLNFAVPVPPSSSPHETYFEGRFSNGPVEFEYLWQLLEGRKPGKRKALTPYLESPCEDGRPIREAVNFAFGGSGTALTTISSNVAVPGLLGQVGLFACALRGQAPPTDALYAIWSGGNDYIRYLSPNPPQANLTPAQVVSNISDSIFGLYALGARRIIVLNYPDLGRIPLVLGTPGSALLTGLVQQHNALLAAALASPQLALLPGLELIPVDVSAAFNDLPSGANATLPALDALFPPPGPGQVPMSLCLIIDTDACQDVPTFDVGLNYVFWDVEHPTTEFHRLIATQIYQRLVDEE
jgi:outer membrane lipase/esterase